MFDLLKKKISGVVNSFISKKEEEIKSGGAPEEVNAADTSSVQDVQPQKLERRRVDNTEQKEDKTTSSEGAEKAAEGAGSEKREIEQEEKRGTHPKPEQEKQGSKVKLSIATKLKGTIFRNISLNDSEIGELVQNIEISLLQSDVAHETADKFATLLQNKLRSDKFDYRNIQAEISRDVREALLGVLESTGKGPDIMAMAKEKREKGEILKVLFIGPNGTGKTTTIAKVANLIKNSGLGVVISASDTFRAAAIEQTEHHGYKVGVPVIKSGYGADPASVAFDAIEYARAHRSDVVLVDTAGRQETNKNLIMELQKMVRVSKPDITIFVGESTAGNAIARQISELQKSIKIDGIILTKLDCDAKGGNAISIADITCVPIIFLCVGESYDAIMKYDPYFIIDAVVPAS